MPQGVRGQSHEEAKSALNAGKYAEARSTYQRLLRGADADFSLAGPYSETFIATGEVEEGLAVMDRLLAQAPEDPYVRYAKGRLLVEQGEYGEAETLFLDAFRTNPDFWENLLALGELYEATGQRRVAVRAYSRIYNAYRQNQFRDAESLAMAGKAAASIEEYHEANQAFQIAERIDDSNVKVKLWWADLFRTKYNEAQAQELYEEAIDINEAHPDLFVGYARTFGGFGAQEQFAQEALKHNPRHIEAQILLAELRILDAQYEAAEDILVEALEINPSSVQALAQLASIRYLQSDSAAFNEIEAQALAINPRAGDFYVTVANNLTRRFRYPDAALINEKAVDVQFENAKAKAQYGLSLLRVGEIRQAKRYLEASFDQDPFNIFVGNTLTLVEGYDAFETLESEHFRLLIHQDEAPILGQAILDMAEVSYDSLSQRYPYEPEGKIILEAYHVHDDFAVRVGGIPNLGLLGVSFGDIVAFDTPRAQQGDSYNWARTLWHELGHTFAIGASDHRVPRWFTEGLSVYEEHRARPEWRREMEFEFFSALDAGQLLTIRELDQGFTRPKFPGQVLLSYYHASRIIGYLVAEKGFDVIANVLLALGEGQDIATSIEGEMGMSLEALDEAFHAYIRAEQQQYASALAGLPNLYEEAEDVSEGDNLVENNRFLTLLREGNDALRLKDLNGAEAKFNEALTIFERYTVPGNPYQGLAEIHRERNENDQLKHILERFLMVSEHGAAEALELAALYREEGDVDNERKWLEWTLHISPYNEATHTRLATLYEESGAFDDAIGARRALLALDPVDEATAYYDLARALWANQQRLDAKRAVLQALEQSPGFREAQQLLLETVDSTQTNDRD